MLGNLSYSHWGGQFSRGLTRNKMLDKVSASCVGASAAIATAHTTAILRFVGVDDIVTTESLHEQQSTSTLFGMDDGNVPCIPVLLLSKYTPSRMNSKSH